MSEDKLLINYPKSNNSEIISNKQIEKMAKDSGCPSRQPCKECLLLNECDRIVFAEGLYNKNYREQSEVAREIFEEIGQIKKEYASGDIDGNELYVQLYLLEKKYTEEE